MSLASGSIDLKSLNVAGTPNKYITKITGGDGITIHDSQNEEVNYAVINSEGMEIYQGETTSDSVRVAKFGPITTIGESTGAYLRVENNGISLKDRTLTIFQIYSEELDEEDKPTIDIFLYKNSNQISGRKLIHESGAGRTYLPNKFYFNIDTANLTLGDTITISLIWNGYFKFNARGSGSSTIFGNKSYSNELESFSFTYGTSSNQSCSKTFTYTIYGSFTRTAFYIRYDGNNQFELVSNTNYYTGGGPDKYDYVIVSFYKDIQATTSKLLNGIPNVIIGAQELGHTKLDYHSLQMIDKEGNAYLYVSDLRDINGMISENFIGDGSNNTFYLLTEIAETPIVTVDGNTVECYYTNNDNYGSVFLTSAPNNNAAITIKYLPLISSYTPKAYTIGIRGEGKTGVFSIEEGFNNIASGLLSHASGYNTKALHQYTYTQNIGTIAAQGCQTAIGTYNEEDTYSIVGDTLARGKFAFIIGNGTADNARSNALTVDWNGNMVIPNSSAYKSKNSSGDERRLCYITTADNNIYGYDSYNNNEGGSYLYGNTIGIYSKGNINIGRAADSNTININGTVSGSLNITGQYQRHGNTYIVTDSASVDNKTVYGTSSSNDSYASFEIDAAKTGYDLIGVISYNFQNASSNGANSSYIMCYGCSFDGTTDKVTVKVRNLTSANAKIKITVRCLYRAV